MSDRGLRQDILHALEFGPSVNAENIGVAVKDGVVTLTGLVASYAEKAVAERVVGREGHRPGNRGPTRWQSSCLA